MDMPLHRPSSDPETETGDRLSFTSDSGVWMQRLGPWLIVSDDERCGGGGGGDGQNATFGGVYTRRP
jgi:hypothetical protein